MVQFTSPWEFPLDRDPLKVKWWEAIIILPFLILVLTAMCLFRPKGGW